MPIETQVRILVDILIALVLGGIIGFEREKRDKPAGFRTNILIAGASAIFIILGQYIVEEMKVYLSDQALGVDPTRIVHAVIFGVSFIGAGTILKSQNKETIHYLTTSATILMSAAAGMAVALRLYILALGVTLLTLLINTLVRKFYE